jgi:hypothetical protein
MAEHDSPEKRDHQWDEARKCELEDMVETEKQIEDSDARDTQLVSGCVLVGFGLGLLLSTA